MKTSNILKGGALLLFAAGLAKATTRESVDGAQPMSPGVATFLLLTMGGVLFAPKP